MKGIPIIVGVTGHRDVFEADVSRMKKEFRKFLDELQNRYKHSEILVASGLARGADTYAVEAAVEVIGGHSYGYIGVLPMARDEYALDFDDESSYHFLGETFDNELALYDYLCNGATVLQEGPFYIESFKKELRDLCYEAQGKKLADHADYLVAFLDERSELKQGGTAHVVEIRKTGVCAYNLNKSQLGEMAGGRSTYIIPVRRESLPPIDLIEDQMSMDIVLDEGIDMDRYDIFNAKMLKEKVSGRLKMDKLDISESKRRVVTILDDIFSSADELSIKHGNRKKRTMWGIFIMLIVAIFSFEFYGINDWVGYLAIYVGVYILLFFMYNIVMKQMDDHRQYIEYRALAEFLRVQYFWSLAGVNESVVDHFSLKNREIMGWVRLAMRSVDAMIQPDVKSLDSSVAEIDYVVEDWIRGQRKYYKTMKEGHNDVVSSKDLIYKAGFIIGFLMIIWVLYESFVNQVQSNEPLILWLVSLSGLIATTTAIYGDKVDVHSFEELIDRYRMMDVAFYRAEEAIERIGDDQEALKEVLIEIGVEVINEIGDWYYIQKSKEGKLS